MPSYMRYQIMKKVLVVISLLAVSPMFGQVQERFKKTETNTNTEEQTENRENPSSNKPATSAPQQQSKEDFWDNVMIGGGLSVSFGGYTSIYLAPSVGYRVNDYWIVGTGYNYMYFKWNDAYNRDSYESTIHGPKFFVNFFPFNGLYTGAQFEYLNHDVAYQNISAPQGYEFRNEWTPVLFLEAGISQKVGNNGIIQLGVRYNVLDDYDSPYYGAFFPVIGFMF